MLFSVELCDNSEPAHFMYLSTVSNTKQAGISV